MLKYLKLICFFVFLSFSLQLFAKVNVPNILLAQVYKGEIDIADYWVSEKLDGMRAVWDGEQLISRNGNRIHAPAWFTQAFPKQPLDGELWIGRAQFEQLVSAVQKQTPIDSEWQQVAYYVFELPQAKGTFTQRVQQMSKLVKLANSPYLKAVKQFRVADEKSLKNHLNQVLAQKGEGLMLHLAAAEYTTGRSQRLLKLKPQLDDEAKVLAHLPGRGKLQGKMGALLVETRDGIQFKLGTGFSNAVRENPPAIGSWVTFQYRDKTAKGKPKFARYLRARTDLTKEQN